MASAFCAVDGTSGCNQKWAAVEKIGAAAEKAHWTISVREAEADAAAVAKKLGGGHINYCGLPGQACDAKREALARRDAFPDPRRLRGGQINYCGLPGQACDAKRDAIAKKHHKAMGGGHINYCGLPGQACDAKRDAEPEPEADAEAKRLGFNLSKIEYAKQPPA